MNASNECPRSSDTPPACNAACCGIPSRKSANAAPVLPATRAAARGIQAGEGERTARVRIELTVAAVQPHISADAQLVLAEECIHVSLTAMRVSVRRVAAALCTPVKPAIVRFGTPQFSGVSADAADAG